MAAREGAVAARAHGAAGMAGDRRGRGAGTRHGRAAAGAGERALRGALPARRAPAPRARPRRLLQPSAALPPLVRIESAGGASGSAGGVGRWLLD